MDLVTCKLHSSPYRLKALLLRLHSAAAAAAAAAICRLHWLPPCPSVPSQGSQSRGSSTGKVTGALLLLLLLLLHLGYPDIRLTQLSPHKGAKPGVINWEADWERQDVLGNEQLLGMVVVPAPQAQALGQATGVCALVENKGVGSEGCKTLAAALQVHTEVCATLQGGLPRGRSCMCLAATNCFHGGGACTTGTGTRTGNR